jgi:hypothetical protein
MSMRLVQVEQDWHWRTSWPVVVWMYFRSDTIYLINPGESEASTLTRI